MPATHTASGSSFRTQPGTAPHRPRFRRWHRTLEGTWQKAAGGKEEGCAGGGAAFASGHAEPYPLRARLPLGLCNTAAPRTAVNTRLPPRLALRASIFRSHMDVARTCANFGGRGIAARDGSLLSNITTRTRAGGGARARRHCAGDDNS